MDFGSFKKLDVLPDEVFGLQDGMMRLVVKLRQGAERPAYLPLRAQAGPQIFTTEIAADQLPRLEDDPAILSFKAATRLNRID